MYLENPYETPVIVGSMNMGYVSDMTRTRTRNQFRLRFLQTAVTDLVFSRCYGPEAQPGQNFEGGKFRAKLEPRARSARELRVKPELRAKPEIERGRGLGRGLGEPLPRKFLEIST